MFCSHPFFNINRAWWILKLIGAISFISCNKLLLLSWIIILLEIRFEMLQESNLLLQLLWKASETILSHHILFFVCSDCFSFVIIELCTRWFCHNFCRVIEENSCTQIWKEISKTILAWVIYPFCHPHLGCLVNVALGVTCGWSCNLIMAYFNWLSTNWVSCTCSFWRQRLVIFTRIWSDWNRRYRILWLHGSLIADCRHFVINISTSLSWESLVLRSSVSEDLCLIWSCRSLATIHSLFSSERISWCSSCWINSSLHFVFSWSISLIWWTSSIMHKLSNVLAWRDTSKQTLW